VPGPRAPQARSTTSQFSVSIQNNGNSETRCSTTPQAALRRLSKESAREPMEAEHLAALCALAVVLLGILILPARATRCVAAWHALRRRRSLQGFIGAFSRRCPDRRPCAPALGGRLMKGLARPARSWLNPRSIPPHPVKQPRTLTAEYPTSKRGAHRLVPYMMHTTDAYRLMHVRRQACRTGGWQGGWRSLTRSKGAKRRTCTQRMRQVMRPRRCARSQEQQTVTSR